MEHVKNDTSPENGFDVSSTINDAGSDSTRTVSEISIKQESQLGGSPESSSASMVSSAIAVEVRDVFFTYGKGKRAVNALNGVDITVPEGQM